MIPDPRVEAAKTEAVRKIEEGLTKLIEEQVAKIGSPIRAREQEAIRQIIDKQIEDFNGWPLDKRLQFAADWLAGIPGCTTEGLADARLEHGRYPCEVRLDVKFTQPIEQVIMHVGVVVNEGHDPRPLCEDDPQEDPAT